LREKICNFDVARHSRSAAIGWIEENSHPYFFVLQIETPDKNADVAAIRIKILKDILKQYGFFEGKK
jgi:beta-lactamase class D